MGWKYTPDHVGTGAYLRSSPELKAELYRRAVLGRDTAVALSPFRTGRLRSTGHLEFRSDGGVKRDRMEYEIVFDVSYAAAATWPSRTAYLEAAIAVMEAGS